MMQRLAILNVVGLTDAHLGSSTPNITSLANQTSISRLNPPLPAVTSTVQSTILTGLEPKEHGIVANGWHERETNETHFWRQSNSLVQGNKIWDSLRQSNPEITVANLFWWFNMYSSVDYAVTPRPQYKANGKKIPDVWTTPPELRNLLQHKFGQFPLFKFWGPAAGIESSEWIANAAIEVDRLYHPTLSFVYLPHLDYPLQRLGPNHTDIAGELTAIDGVVGKLMSYYSSNNIDICVLSEYAIEEVNDAVAINKVLRKNNLLSIRDEGGREYLDARASVAFAVPDHQIAHVYVQDESNVPLVAKVLQDTSGVDCVHTGEERGALAHNRCGDIVVVSDADKWFSHDWWDSPSKAPDYQATVDIHKKPGYDPRELFLAKGWRGSKLRIALKLLLRLFGQRTLFDVITLDSKRVKGSHGRTPDMGAPAPILIPPKCAKKMPHSLPCAALPENIFNWVTCSP
ncbi:alkaline phosphatase family protein [bacterium]|nr:alkaline phosphatase family protein [bacterium]